MLINLRRPKCVVLKEEKSASGKYVIFYGHHYVKGKICFDVGTINQASGEIISRHYNETEHDGATIAKSEALKMFHDFVKKLQRKAQSEEKEDNNAWIGHEYRRQLKKGFN